MARKNILVYEVAKGHSLSSDFNTNPTVINYLDNVSYQINITTTDSTGTFSVQASNDYLMGPAGVVQNPGNWASLTLTGTPTVSAANDTILIDLNEVPFTAVRLSYSHTIAGTGTCDIFMTAKQLGG